MATLHERLGAPNERPAVRGSRLTIRLFLLSLWCVNVAQFEEWARARREWTPDSPDALRMLHGRLEGMHAGEPAREHRKNDQQASTKAEKWRFAPLAERILFKLQLAK